MNNWHNGVTIKSMLKLYEIDSTHLIYIVFRNWKCILLLPQKELFIILTDMQGAQTIRREHHMIRNMHGYISYNRACMMHPA